MKISKEVEVFALEFMTRLQTMRPKILEMQKELFDELSKGPGKRDLLSVIDAIILLGKEGVDAAFDFVTSCEKFGGTFVHGQVDAISNASRTGDFSGLDELSDEVKNLIRTNFLFNHNLEQDMVDKFGKHAMTLALAEDGLIPEFQRRSIEIMGNRL